MTARPGAVLGGIKYGTPYGNPYGNPYGGTPYKDQVQLPSAHFGYAPRTYFVLIWTCTPLHPWCEAAGPNSRDGTDEKSHSSHLPRQSLESAASTGKEKVFVFRIVV
jgi:hypothetical protein